MATNTDAAYWNRHARKYDRSMTLLGKPMGRTLELTAEAVRGRKRVLEVAAGTGLVTLALAREAEQVVATDYAAAMVEELQGRVRSQALANVTAEQADLYDLRYEDATFDAIVAANVLHLVPDLPGALKGLRRVLQPDGVLILPTFCHDETRVSWLLSRALAVTGFPGARRFTAKSLLRAIEDGGLHVERHEVVPGPIPITYVQAR